MIATKVNVRVCALCGREEGAGRPPTTPVSMLVKWAVEAGVPLKRPDSAFMHLPCTRSLRVLITRAVKARPAR